MSTIENNVTAQEFRERAEDKNTLSKKRSLYVGTGNKISENPVVYETVAIEAPDPDSVGGRPVLTNDSDPNNKSGLRWYDVVDLINSESGNVVELANTASYAQGAEDKGTIDNRFINIDNRFINVDNKISDIEERLTNLGFKEGSVSLLGTIVSASVSQNKITRQGNYCLFNLSLTDVGISVDYRNPTYIGKLSSDFLPLNYYKGNCGVNSTDAGSGYFLTISKAGEVYLNTGTSTGATVSSLDAVGLGYEAKPIN